jgi:hypothetical protein
MSRTGPRYYRVDWSHFSRLAHRRFVVSIVRIGLAETKKFSEGYEAIFGKSKSGAAPSKAAPKKKASPKASAKKKTKKK